MVSVDRSFTSGDDPHLISRLFPSAVSSANGRSFSSAFASASSAFSGSNASGSFATSYSSSSRTGNVPVLPRPALGPPPFNTDISPAVTTPDANDTSDYTPTEETQDTDSFPIYAITLSVLLLLAMTTALLYFLCRCVVRRKKRQEQLATITPKVADPRMAGVRQDQTIQFVVPTTILITETTEDSLSETDYSSSGAKTLPILLDKRRKRAISGFHINPEDLQHGLYVGVKAASERGAFLGDLGKIGFNLSYNVVRSQLLVRLIGASDLPCLFLKTTANPCAKVVLLPDKTTKYMSKVQRNTMNPVFNETFTFTVRKEDLNDKKLKISVWDYDRFSRKCLIGQILYSVKDSGLSNNFGSDSSWTGDIWVDLKQETVSRHSGNGEMLFSLSYNPDTSNLTLTVLKVRGLIMRESGKDEAVYVKITLYVRRKLVRTKKTPSKRKTPEMEFNDTFNIHVPQAALSEVDFLVTLCEKSQSIGGKNVLGRTQVGSNCLSDQGLQHWQDMLLSPKSTCAQWHTLCSY